MFWFIGLIVVGLLLLVLSLPVVSRHHQHRSNRSGVPMRYDNRNGMVPDHWNEIQIRDTLEQLIKHRREEPNLMTAYLGGLRSRFLDWQDSKVIERRTKYLETVVKNLATSQEAATLLYELRRLPVKQATKDIKAQRRYDEAVASKEDRIEVAKLKQEAKKKKLQEQIAKSERKINFFEGKRSKEARQMDEARQRRKLDFQWHAETGAGSKVEKLAALQRWKKQKRQEVIADKSLTDYEREEQLEMLDESYDEAKRKIETDDNIYEDD